MVQYSTVILRAYSLLITIAAAIMGYLLSIPCGKKMDIEGDNNIVRNAQKIDILSPNIALTTNAVRGKVSALNCSNG